MSPRVCDRDATTYFTSIRETTLMSSTSSNTPLPMVADPLGFLIGIEGVAMLRAFVGEYDRPFLERRIARVRELLDQRDQLGTSRDVPAVSAADGYDAWAPTYDTQQNGLLGPDAQTIAPLVDALVPGIVLEAACGTGRHLQRLIEKGWHGIGVDISPGMLAVARQKMPDVDLREGRLEDLPVASGSVDLVLCTLALEHVRDLETVYQEFARVLRPGGRLVITDTLGLVIGTRRSAMIRQNADGEYGYIPSYNHGIHRHVAAAVQAGLSVDDSQLGLLGGVLSGDEDPVDLAEQPVANMWFLMTADPEAANAVYDGHPHHFWIAAHKK